MFEHHREPLLSKALFARRVLRHLVIAATIIGGGLGMGVLGYHFCEQLTWLDSLLNASMILAGMGPVDPIKHTAGKWFASGYALFSGVAFISTVGVLFAPLVHRFLHKFHLEARGER